MIRLRLRYLTGSKAGDSGRMWDILEPSFPEYANGLGRRPTMSKDMLLDFLRSKEVIR